MTLSEQFAKSCVEAREHVARSCGAPLVVTLEAMGYRIVPEWVIPSFARVLLKAEEAKEKGASES